MTAPPNITDDREGWLTLQRGVGQHCSGDWYRTVLDCAVGVGARWRRKGEEGEGVRERKGKGEGEGE